MEKEKTKLKTRRKEEIKIWEGEKIENKKR